MRVKSNDAKDVVVEVTDCGPGIRSEHRFKVFDGTDKALSREEGGASLGLSIPKWALEVHGAGSNSKKMRRPMDALLEPIAASENTRAQLGCTNLLQDRWRGGIHVMWPCWKRRSLRC